MRFPSVSRIEKILEIPRDKAKDVRAIIDGKENPRDYKRVEDWVRQCRHAPALVECQSS
jgi:uncharacterized Fe-S cluster-containing radical SAM superfamily enzyme